MATRRAKQIIYGAFYIIVFGAIGFGIYRGFVYRAPSCFDTVQNQGELGVDCGGPCSIACLSQAQDLAVGDLQTFKTKDGRYTFLARVENHNSLFAAPRFDYAFQLFDASGNVLASYPGTSFIYADEAKYVIVPNVPGAAGFDYAKLVIQAPAWVQTAKMGDAPRFNNPLSVGQSSISSTTITVHGSLTDADVSHFAPIYLVSIFYGSNGLPSGASQAQIDSIAPSQSVPFSVAYPAGTDINPALTKVYAYALRP